METEIICLSSDGEEDSQKENKKKECITNSMEVTTFSDEKVEVICNDDDEKIEGPSLKRKAFEINENKESCNVEKKQKLSAKKKIPMVIIKPISELFPMIISDNKKTSPPVECDKDDDKKPKLIIKEKKSISYIKHDIFPLFLSLCLQKCPRNEKKDMDKIIDKLKRRYEQLDLTYASSEKFASFLSEKREAIERDDNRKIYVYIQEVMNEMKKSIKKKSSSWVTESYDAVPSTSYITNNDSVNDVTELDYEDDEESMNSTMSRKRELLKTMSRCEARIKELENAEVDFDEDYDSTYIKLERYKERMVDLYAKLCEITGDNADAERAYLRPKHISTTGIVVVDQAITNFINQKITQRNQKKKKKYKTGAEKIIFPDCRDIVECINHCNEKQNLGLEKRKIEQMAKKAFKEIGEHLQRIRRNDYWDTFSLYLENTEEDPATKNEELAKKLSENRVEGEKKLSAVFEKYSRKQEEMKEEIIQDDDSIASDEEDESVLDEELEKDELSEIGSDLENNSSEEPDVETDKIGLKDNENGVTNVDEDMNENTPSDVVSISQDVHEDVPNNIAINTIQKDTIKRVKIISVEESDVVVSKVGNKTILRIQKPCTSDVGEKIQEVPLTTVSTTDRTNNITKTEEDPNCVEVIMDTAIQDTDVINKNTQVTKENVKETTEDVAEIENEIVTSEEREIVTQEVTDVAIENVPSNQQAEEEKIPLLRVRSFAKPPTTWEDNTKQKADKTVEKNVEKKIEKEKEVIDLTNETPSKPVASKCTIKVGNKVLPLIKSQTVLIPAGNKNIISVQNITNNYLKLNSRTGQIITPVRDIQSIILPSVQTNSLQNQPQNSNAGICRYRIIQPKPISVGKKPTAQPAVKPTDVRSANTKKPK
ncbi:death domain-associated protein 6-like [Pseudomyrmex gracilis]|uniref:death domain-associated protein 6-like n=1 Tax=Pseudomyrmex gracilis TaxID=219809 RepID=UPI000994DF51|nr:death domain-associated protein 6-like [Pseudomyrmex gracilis]XP_020285818.1 death domain-associated protein 6-like [Pseudomyrmex gracilis]XP_020285819.1 death domain-associated protein 6-like [Pseudomyrmex gracilis]